MARSFGGALRGAFAAGLTACAASTAGAAFTGYIVTATPVSVSGQNLVRYEVYARFNGPTDTLLNAYNLSLVSTACGDPWAGFWHKDISDDNGGTLSQQFGTWAPSLVGSATTNRPYDSFLLVGGNPIGTNTTTADPSWASGGSGSHVGGSAGWNRSDLVNNGTIGWFNSNPPNIQGRVGVAPNTSTDVKVAQFVLRGGLPERTFSLTVGYNTGTPGALYGTSTFVIGASVPADCNGNGTADSCEIAANASIDCDGNGLIDSCELSSGSAPDCDGDGRIDACSILAGGVADVNANGVPDMCEPGAGSPLTAWTTASGGNGHGYQIVVVPGGIDWLAAYEAAAKRGGHLVTVNSAAEDTFLRQLIANNPESRHYATAPWMGLYQNTGVPGFSEPLGGWTWVTGEALSYSGWLFSEPNNFICGGQPENYACFYYSGPDLGWNDQQFSGSCVTPAPRQRVSSYVIEWQRDCNSNGTVDALEIAAGSAADCNQNGVPDACDIAAGTTTDCNGNGTPDTCDIAAGNAVDANGNSVPDSCEAANDSVEWTSAQGGNGHWYQIVATGSSLTWTTAKAAAEAKGGHLFTANSGAENAFVFAKVGSRPAAWRNYYLDVQVGPWIGAERVSQTIGDAAFRWVTNESFVGFAWLPGDPNLPQTTSEKVQLLSRGAKAPTWSDAVNSINSGVVSYIVEYDADCNGD
ncbi:MAG: lectin-like protein, partial [Planctomycetota bacterium]